MNNSEKAFVSWSGGKDCSLALYRALKAGINPLFLINTVTEDCQRSKSHGVPAQCLRMQADALGMKIVQQPTSDASYETEFKKAIYSVKSQGVSAGVFGDIDFNEHRTWIDRVCAETGIKPYYPLWEESQKKLMADFIGAGFTAVVVSVKQGTLGEEWLGRRLDQKFLDDISLLEGITPCGEAGEYHSLVIDGPVFKKRLELTKTEKVSRDNHWFLDILECKLAAK
jgi:diphthine-ammonia ligase